MHFITRAAIFASEQRLHIHNPGFCKDPGSVLFGEIQITEIKRILGAVTAAHDAATTGYARISLRPFSVEKRIRKDAARRRVARLEDSYSGGIEGGSAASCFGGSLEQVVGRSEDGVLGHAQHARRGLIMPGHLGLPISQALPGTKIPYFGGRSQQGSGISDGASAHSAAMKNGGVREQAHVEETAQTEAGTPEPAMNGPTRAGQGVFVPPPAHLHHSNRVTLLGEAVGCDAAPEAGSDHDKVEVKLLVACRHTGPLVRTPANGPDHWCTTLVRSAIYVELDTIKRNQWDSYPASAHRASCLFSSRQQKRCSQLTHGFPRPDRH